MKNKQRYITAGATIAAAAVTAHLMQRNAGSGNAPAVTASAATTALIGSTPERAQNTVTVVTPAADGSNNAGVQLASLGVPSLDGTLDTPPVQVKITGDVVLSDEPIEAPALETRAFPTGGQPVPPSEAATPSALPEIGAELSSRIAAIGDVPTSTVTDQPAVSSFGLSCGPILSVAPVSDGLVGLTLTAPCRENQTVDVQHGPLNFTAMTDELGNYLVTAPAFTSEASFSVTFEDGAKVEASTNVSGVDALERVAIVARSDAGFQIHAREFGASYGDPGHIWIENPGRPALAATDSQGYLMQLGDPSIDDGHVVQVYTFPRDNSSNGGVVRLSVEAEVTARNCGKQVEGQTVERDFSGDMTSMTISVAVPECNAIGEFLVLKNLLRDLRIASSN